MPGSKYSNKSDRHFLIVERRRNKVRNDKKFVKLKSLTFNLSNDLSKLIRKDFVNARKLILHKVCVAEKCFEFPTWVKGFIFELHSVEI